PILVPPAESGTVKATDLPPAPAAWEASKQEQYDAALLDALNLVAERKLPEALTILQKAQAVQDTEQVQREIEKIKGLIEQQAAAERTVVDIQTVLKDGKPEDAARLAATGLQQYGGTDVAGQLAKLKRQADALLAIGLDDNSAR